VRKIVTQSCNVDIVQCRQYTRSDQLPFCMVQH